MIDPGRKGRGASAGLRTAVTMAVLACVAAAAPAGGANPAWVEHEPGMATAEIRLVARGGAPFTVHLVRIDPARFSLRLLAASQVGGGNRTIPAWSREHGFVAAINAGMYQADNLSHVGYMRNFDHLNNPRLNGFNALLAFNPAAAGLPEVAILDRECEDAAGTMKRYHSVAQNIRMIDCRGNNVWKSDKKYWGSASLAIDGSGRVLFVFCPSYLAVRELSEALLVLPLDIRRAVYLEGGSEAGLFYLGNGRERLYVGGYGTVQSGDLDEAILKPVPNVIGVVRKGR